MKRLALQAPCTEMIPGIDAARATTRGTGVSACVLYAGSIRTAESGSLERVIVSTATGEDLLNIDLLNHQRLRTMARQYGKAKDLVKEKIYNKIKAIAPSNI